jgi:hypothetical protein
MHVHDTIYGISADSTDADDLARIAEGEGFDLEPYEVIGLTLAMLALAVLVALI